MFRFNGELALAAIITLAVLPVTVQANQAQQPLRLYINGVRVYQSSLPGVPAFDQIALYQGRIFVGHQHRGLQEALGFNYRPVPPSAEHRYNRIAVTTNTMSSAPVRTVQVPPAATNTGRSFSGIPLETITQIITATFTQDLATNSVRVSTAGWTPELQTEIVRRPVVLDEPTFFTQEELREMIKYAVPREYTIPTTPHPNRRMTQQELEVWIQEYRNMGGINVYELQLVYYLNEARIAEGLNPVGICPTRSMAARLAAQLVKEGHAQGRIDNFYGGSNDRLKLFDINLRTAENVGGDSGNRTAENQIQGWKNSSGHRRVMMGPPGSMAGNSIRLVGVGSLGSGNFLATGL